MRGWTGADRASPSRGALKTAATTTAKAGRGVGFYLGKKKCHQPPTKILVLLSASVERLGVSRIRDFLFYFQKWTFSLIIKLFEGIYELFFNGGSILAGGWYCAK